MNSGCDGGGFGVGAMPLSGWMGMGRVDGRKGKRLVAWRFVFVFGWVLGMVDVGDGGR